MTDLMPITVLGNTAALAETFGALIIRENAGLALASLALRKGQAAPSPFGLALPGVGRAITKDEYGAFWTGLDQWMIEAEGKAEADFAASLRAEAPGQSVTEQTDGWVAFDITSDQGAAPIEMLMRKLVNIDTRSFDAGSAARTLLGHLGVFVIRRSEDRLTVIGMRSVAGTIWHDLSVTARRLERQSVAAVSDR
ncbi:MAG: sarcosine oxidase subunit gamma [Thalassovita sp.]|nr:sarcosine oxidase subunit gamma [Thalassovita sp.]